jgi:1-aminocyclopropane-1-carboxylate deaminase/D-cysteine desulfhydrase-like pyridoxal-dependent ACC family enzyme
MGGKEEEGGDEEKMSVCVYTVPCCGDGAYLRRQMERLGRLSCISEEQKKGKGLSVFPSILEYQSTTTQHTQHVFGKPDPHLLSLWQQFKDTHNLELDLLYGPHTWQVLLSPENWQRLGEKHSTVLYIHTGGLEGVESQLARYRYLGLLK